VSAVPGWYPDPEDPARARWFDGSTWTEHVQPLTSGGTVLSDPPGPTDPGSMGPPPTGHTPQSGPRTSKRLPVAVLVAVPVAALVTVAAGLFMLLRLNSVEEVSIGEYRDRFCDRYSAVFKELDDATRDSSRAYERLDIDYDTDSDRIDYSGVSEREAEAYLVGTRRVLVATERYVAAVGDFAKGHQIRRGDGSELRDDLLEWREEATEALAEIRKDLNEVDPTDRGRAVSRIEKLTESASDFPSLRRSDEAEDLFEAFSEKDDRDGCTHPYPGG
jgi:hypothetical protein